MEKTEGHCSNSPPSVDFAGVQGPITLSSLLSLKERGREAMSELQLNAAHEVFVTDLVVD